MAETDRIKEVYEARESDQRVQAISAQYRYTHFVRCERELHYTEMLRERDQPLDELTLLEIGAGAGDNLLFFHRLGVPWQNLYANELLETRSQVLAQRFPQIALHRGDALTYPSERQFDIVMQSTVFTSILDADFKQRLARKAFELVKPGGLVLWYDFAFDNPRNQAVKGIPRQAVRALFPAARQIDFRRVTLAPPLGRRIGNWYSFVNVFPFLRTHLIAQIYR